MAEMIDYSMYSQQYLDQAPVAIKSYQDQIAALSGRLGVLPKNDPQYLQLQQQLQATQSQLQSWQELQTKLTDFQNTAKQMYYGGTDTWTQWLQQNNLNAADVGWATGAGTNYSPEGYNKPTAPPVAVQPVQGQPAGGAQQQRPFRLGDNFKGAGMFNVAPTSGYKTLAQQGYKQAPGAPVMPGAPTPIQQSTGLFSGAGGTQTQPFGGQ